jgi:hypothetical protein
MGTFLVVSFDVNNLTALIMPAIGADTMGQTGFAAIGANHHIARFEGIMCPTAISATR